MKGGGGKISPSKEAAYIAVACALLIGGQYVFSFVVGVEIVTLILVCFASVFGVKRGVILATAFSILRCVIFGFTPAVLVLYLIYYPALAALFGGLGRFKSEDFSKVKFAVAVNILLISVCVACVLGYALDIIKISRLYKVTLQILLWVIFSLCAVLLIAFDFLFIAQRKFKKGNAQILRLIAYAAIGAVCTVCFTLLDDVISPLFLGMNRLSALSYFYASFAAMLPQTACTIVCITTLFLPVTKVLTRFCVK
ncbi:MAG: hypothetical protein K2K60_04820 [Clostridia bacterium]|nr:hypothetical protein [Clostridia bacterium]